MPLFGDAVKGLGGHLLAGDGRVWLVLRCLVSLGRPSLFGSDGEIFFTVVFFHNCIIVIDLIFINSNLAPSTALSDADCVVTSLD